MPTKKQTRLDRNTPPLRLARSVLDLTRAHTDATNSTPIPPEERLRLLEETAHALYSCARNLDELRTAVATLAQATSDSEIASPIA